MSKPVPPNWALTKSAAVPDGGEGYNDSILWTIRTVNKTINRISWRENLFFPPEASVSRVKAVQLSSGGTAAKARAAPLGAMWGSLRTHWTSSLLIRGWWLHLCTASCKKRSCFVSELHKQSWKLLWIIDVVWSFSNKECFGTCRGLHSWVWAGSHSVLSVHFIV